MTHVIATSSDIAVRYRYLFGQNICDKNRFRFYIYSLTQLAFRLIFVFHSEPSNPNIFEQIKTKSGRSPRFQNPKTLNSVVPFLSLMQMTKIIQSDFYLYLFYLILIRVTGTSKISTSIKPKI